MKYIIILFVGCSFFFITPVHAQNNSSENRAIVNAQSHTAALFRLALENNMPDSAMKFVDKKYLAKNLVLRQEIIQAATILSHVKNICLPRYSDISYTDTATVFSFKYTIPPPRFTLSLSFQKGNQASMITLINFKSQEQLDEEKSRNPSEPQFMPPPPPHR
jgi:hypothetical protein